MTLAVMVSFIKLGYYGTYGQDTKFGLVHLDHRRPMKRKVIIQGILPYEYFGTFSLSCRLKEANLEHGK